MIVAADNGGKISSSLYVWITFSFAADLALAVLKYALAVLSIRSASLNIRCSRFITSRYRCDTSTINFYYTTITRTLTINLTFYDHNAIQIA